MGWRDGRDTAAEGSAEDTDERRRLSTLDLVGLAAGGVVGSGWLLAAGQVYWVTGDNALWAWVIGGALMLLIAAVMVELGIAAPKTGGLIFVPLQAAGPLLATVVAAGLWIAYAANPASEAAAMVRGLAYWVPSLMEQGRDLQNAADLSAKDLAQPYDLSVSGWLCTVAFMALITALNLLPPRRLIRLNVLVTAVKVLVPVLIVVLLGFDLFSQFDKIEECVPGDARHFKGGAEQSSGSLPLHMVLGGAVIYAYIGFQAPLDSAGNVKRRGIGEAARLRWAVYGTLVGAFLLYTALQWVFGKHCGTLNANILESPYAQFATGLGMAWLAGLIFMNAVLSPMGAGIVFTHALTREVAALSRAHLTHRGLQTARRASFRFRGADIDAYWMILLVNFGIGLAMLAAVQGDWGQLVALNSLLTLVIYAMPCVVLAALGPHAFPRPRRMLHMVLSCVAFIAIALVINESGWRNVWQGMAAVGIGSALLLALPWLARLDLPFVGRLLRRYDAQEHVSRFATPGDVAVRPALLFLAHLAMITVCTLLRHHWGGKPGHNNALDYAVLLIVAVSAAVVFPLMVRACRDYTRKVTPSLTVLRHEDQVKSSVTEAT
ncbi:APC family permease [Streptomyces blattellae]|uniref:APC family permease n=1 Tax=Streptomyces blattellae TaxID=2569855 RepID=UPI0018ACACC9|nr:APC family permease [Streptomyces blattellae]